MRQPRLFLDKLPLWQYKYSMPVKGHRKADKRDLRLQIRITAAEEKLYLAASRRAGYRHNLSRWIRDTLARAAQAKDP